MLHKQSCRVRHSKSSASCHPPTPRSLSSPNTAAALGGERIPSRAPIYKHSPVSLRAPSHDDARALMSRAKVHGRFLSASPPRIGSHHTLCASQVRLRCSLRQRIPERRGAVELSASRPIRGADAGRSASGGDARTVISVPTSLCSSGNGFTRHRDVMQLSDELDKLHGQTKQVIGGTFFIFFEKFFAIVNVCV